MQRGLFGFFDEEVCHLLEGFFVECDWAVLTSWNGDKLFELAFALEFFGEVDALAVWHYVVGIAMDNHEGGHFLLT